MQLASRYRGRGLHQAIRKVGISSSPLSGAQHHFSGLVIGFVEHVEGEGWHGPIEGDTPTDLTTINDWAKFMIASEVLTFPMVGSLVGFDNVTVGPYRSYDFLLPHEPYFVGPCNSLGALFIACIDLRLKEILTGIWSSADLVKRYLMNLGVRDMIANDSELMGEVNSAYIKHNDDRGCDQIRIDKDGHIAGVIDWE